MCVVGVFLVILGIRGFSLWQTERNIPTEAIFGIYRAFIQARYETVYNRPIEPQMSDDIAKQIFLAKRMIFDVIIPIPVGLFLIISTTTNIF